MSRDGKPLNRLAAALPLTVLLLALACPWAGVDDLTGDTNVEILVTGLLPGDIVELDLDDRTTRLAVAQGAGDRITFYELLMAGEHEAHLLLSRGNDDLCDELEFTTTADERRSLAIDVALFSPCDDDDEDERDAGPESSDDGGDPQRAMERIREVVRDDGCAPDPCEQETRVEDDGFVEVRTDDGDLEGQLSAADLSALSALVLSPAAEMLFQGDDPTCPLATPPAAPTVELERRVQLGEVEDTRVTERLDVTGCTGIAADIRAALAAARAQAAEMSDEEPDDAGP